MECSKHLPVTILDPQEVLVCELEDGTRITLDRYVWLPLQMKGEVLPAKVYLYDRPIEAKQTMVLGLGWLQSHNIVLNFQEDRDNAEHPPSEETTQVPFKQEVRT